MFLAFMKSLTENVHFFSMCLKMTSVTEIIILTTDLFIMIFMSPFRTRTLTEVFIVN